MNNESDEIKVLKERLAIAEGKLKEVGFPKYRSRRIGAMMITLGVVLMITGDRYIGVCFILIGIQFIF